MHEEHAREQYFFDAPTLERLTGFVRAFKRPLLLCCPMLGRYLHERGTDIPVLDVDPRFADLPGFIRWDIYKPVSTSLRPDLILVDPPFNIVKLDQLFPAIRTLAQGDFSTGLMVTSTPRKAPALLATLGAFNLRPTGYRPTFVTVPKDIGIQFYGNVPEEKLTPLLAP